MTEATKSSLVLYNTLRREKAPFEPIDPDRITMYVCGPTVYNRVHIGNARPAVVFDTLFRVLQNEYPRVVYARNITDIDDKIIHRANELGGDWKTLVDDNIATYYEDMDALNILRADDYPRCTDYVDDMIRITEDLIEKGNAYVADDGVYFSIESAPEKYGMLTGQILENVRSGASL
mgnify:CR=1 FL=1